MKRDTTGDGNFDKFSSEELFALAKERARQEKRALREASKAEILELRKQRKKLVVQTKKALAEIDARIVAMGGAVRNVATTNRRGVSETILELVGQAGEITRKDLKEQMKARGFNTTHLSQNLAYLKRNGRVKSPKRSVYTV